MITNSSTEPPLSRRDDRSRRVPPSVDRLSQDVKAKIVDTVTGQPLSIGQSGELRIRGPACMIGYVGDEEANERAFDSSGWLKTGDLCYFDGDGLLFVLDRLKELIKYKASQVPPAELEHLLQSLPGVADAAVVPYPDAEAGQIPVAFIVRQPGHDLTEAQVTDFVAEKVAAYKKKIRRVVFTNSIPKTACGKINIIHLSGIPLEVVVMVDRSFL